MTTLRDRSHSLHFRTAKHMRLLRRVLCESLESRVLLSAADPSGQEQELLWLLNRMRTAPAAELNKLLTQGDFYVQQAMTYFNVDVGILTQQWASLVPAQPVAWDASLATAAAGHNVVMSQQDQQSHQLPGEPSPADRILAAGYDFSAAAENVYAFVSSIIHAHAGFAIDWGYGPGGIQDPPNHRIDMMNGVYRDVGIGVLEASGKTTGPFLATQDFGAPMAAVNSDVVGTIFADGNGNGVYNAGEGLGNVTVTATGKAGTFSTVSRSAGGYQIALPNGTYAVSFAGGSGDAGLPAGSFNVTISGQNVLLDAVAQAPLGTGSAPPTPPAAAATPIGSVDIVNTWPSGAPRTIFGWAFDADTAGGGSAPVQVRLDVDGVAGTPIDANLPRADLQAAVGSTAHGFFLTVPPLTTGSHTLRVMALDAPGGTPTLIGTRTVTVAAAAFGFVDRIDASGVAGWAFDPNLGDLPVQVQVNVDGVTVANALASGNRPDLTSLVGGPAHGFSIPLQGLSGGQHRIDVFATGADGQATLLASRQVAGSGRPIGSLDVADTTAIAGWVMDPDVPNSSISARIDIDGTPFRTIVAGGARKDLAVIGPGNYAFNLFPPALLPGTHTVSVFALDVPTGTPVLIGTRNLVVGGAGAGNTLPVGFVDMLTRGLVFGWAVDPTSPTTAVQIQVTIDGVALPPSPAVFDRPDLAPFFGSTAHGFAIQFGVLPIGPHQIQVSALDVETQTPVVLINKTV